MRLPLVTGLVILAVAGVGLAASAFMPAEGRVYPVSLAAAHKILEDTDPPGVIMSSALSDYRIEARDPSRISWVFQNEGTDLLRIGIDLVPAGDQSTRVTVSLSAPRSGRFGDIAARLAAHPAMGRFLLSGAEEQVAAALQHRDFNLLAISAATAAAMMANIGEIAKIPATVDRLAAEADRSARANIAKAYADEAAGRGPRP